MATVNFEFKANEIEDHYVTAVQTAAKVAGVNFFVKCRAIPYGINFITERDVEEWTEGTPFCFVAVGTENFTPHAPHTLYDVRPELVLWFGNRYTSTGTEYRTLRDKLSVIRHAVAGVTWKQADGQIVDPVLTSESLMIRSAEYGIIMYEQTYAINTVKDSNKTVTI